MTSLHDLPRAVDRRKFAGVLKNANPNHDSQGKFASGGGEQKMSDEDLDAKIAEATKAGKPLTTDQIADLKWGTHDDAGDAQRDHVPIGSDHHFASGSTAPVAKPPTSILSKLKTLGSKIYSTRFASMSSDAAQAGKPSYGGSLIKDRAPDRRRVDTILNANPNHDAAGRFADNPSSGSQDSKRKTKTQSEHPLADGAKWHHAQAKLAAERGDHRMNEAHTQLAEHYEQKIAADTSSHETLGGKSLADSLAEERQARAETAQWLATRQPVGTGPGLARGHGSIGDFLSKAYKKNRAPDRRNLDRILNRNDNHDERGRFATAETPEKYRAVADAHSRHIITLTNEIHGLSKEDPSHPEIPILQQEINARTATRQAMLATIGGSLAYDKIKAGLDAREARSGKKSSGSGILASLRNRAPDRRTLGLGVCNRAVKGSVITNPVKVSVRRKLRIKNSGLVASISPQPVLGSFGTIKK